MEKLIKSITSLDYKRGELVSLFNNTALDFGANVVLADYKICAAVAPKHHTIRAGQRFKVGDKFSPRVWSGKPYNSKQIIIAPDIEIQKIFDFRITTERNSEMRDDLSNFIYIDDKIVMNNDFKTLCTNDGLGVVDFCDWFNICFEDDYKTTSFHGQIICWNKDIKY